MSYLLLDEALDLLDDAVDEGLHDVMAVFSVLDDGGNFNAIASDEGFVPLDEVKSAIRSAFRYFFQEDSQ